MPLRADGTVVPAAETQSDFFNQGMYTLPMVGVIVSVQPSDDKDNRTGGTNPKIRGCQHECTVYVPSLYGQAPTFLENVIIPPESHSGMDNYDEDLPRGVSGLINGHPFRSDLRNIDPTNLDGEWCVVGFIGGRILQSFIMCWWPHPANTFDPATSGSALATAGPSSSGTNLVQYDLKTNRARKFWRKNGSLLLVSREGSLYLDTSQAGRKVWVDESSLLKSNTVPKGGHAQVDMKPVGQMEINWNDKSTTGPQIGAGSSFKTTVCGEQVGSGPNCMFEPDFPQDQPSESPQPVVPSRATARTIIQGREYEVIIKTSKLILAGQAGTGFAGEVDLLVDALLKLKSGGSIEVSAATDLKMSADHIVSDSVGDTEFAAKDFKVATAGKIEAVAGAEVDITATEDATLTGGGNAGVYGGATAVLAATGAVTVQGGARAILEAPMVYLGSTEGTQPALAGLKWADFEGLFIQTIKNLIFDPITGKLTPASIFSLEGLAPLLTQCQSNTVRLTP